MISFIDVNYLAFIELSFHNYYACSKILLSNQPHCLSKVHINTVFVWVVSVLKVKTANQKLLQRFINIMIYQTNYFFEMVQLASTYLLLFHSTVVSKTSLVLASSMPLVFCTITYISNKISKGLDIIFINLKRNEFEIYLD